MKKKRIAALFTAVAVAASALLAGCGVEQEQKTSVESEESQKEESKPSVSESSEVKEELDPVTLTYWMAADKTEDSQLVLDAINEYLADVLPNTTLEIEYIALSEWADKWSKAMASQTPIDIAWFGWMNKINDEVNMGSLMPIDDLVAEYGQGITETLGQDVLDIHKVFDGNLYFLPAWQGLVSGRQAFFFPHENVELMGEGWADEFRNVLYENFEGSQFATDEKEIVLDYIEEYLKTSKDAGMLGYGMNMVTDPVSWVWLANGGRNAGSITTYFDINEKIVYLTAPTSDDYYDRKALSVLHDFYEKGYIREDVASAELKDTKYSLDTKGSNYITHVAGAIKDDENINASLNAGYDIDVFHLSPGGSLNTGFQTGTVIPATAKNPERAMMLINLIYTDPTLYQMIVYGIEGTHYTKNSDGTITIAENCAYTGPSCWMQGTCMNALQTDVTKLDYYPELKEIEEKSEVSLLLGFNFNSEQVSVEYANIQAIMKEYQMSSLVTMDNWEEVLDERNDKLIAAGMEKLIKEFANQILEYVEKGGYKVEIKY